MILLFVSIGAVVLVVAGYFIWDAWQFDAERKKRRDAKRRAIEQSKSDWVSPPGETILDLIEDRGWSLAQFAQHMNMPLRRVQALIFGDLAIGPEIAEDLDVVLKTPASFWLKRESDYRAGLRAGKTIVRNRARK